MTGTELVAILKSPTSKLLFFGGLLIVGAFVLVSFVTRDDDKDAIVEKKELTAEQKEPIVIQTNTKPYQLDKKRVRRNSAPDEVHTPPPVIGDPTPAVEKPKPEPKKRGEKPEQKQEGADSAATSPEAVPSGSRSRRDYSGGRTVPRMQKPNEKASAPSGIFV